MTRWVALAGILLALPSLAPAHGAPARELTVFAAASLREVLADVARGFEARSPGVAVRLSFAGSQELRAQIDHGARADVFAAADRKHVAGLDAAPRAFARNELVVVVPRDNPAGVASFADLPRARRIVVGAPAVPIGGYTLQILERAGGDFKARVLARVVSQELNVRQVLAKVALGEADAGIVYRTDAAAAGDKVATVAIPAALNVTAEYPVVVLRDAPQPKLAQAFVDYLLSAEGQRRLAAAGFSPPAAPPAR